MPEKSQMPMKIQVDATKETDVSKILMPEKVLDASKNPSR